MSIKHASRHLHVAQLHGGGNDTDQFRPVTAIPACAAGADVTRSKDAVD